MSEPGIIKHYLAALRSQLPAPLVDELADGLEEARQRYLRLGLPADDAAQAAVTEFGEPSVIIASFARVNPGRLTARSLLRIGPCVGGCWAAALLIARAWTWHVPEPACILAGLGLLAVIALLAVAALGKHYRISSYAATAGCIGTGTLDAAVVAGVMLAAPSLTWPVIIASAASVTRFAISAKAVRCTLAG